MLLVFLKLFDEMRLWNDFTYLLKRLRFKANYFLWITSLLTESQTIIASRRTEKISLQNVIDQNYKRQT